MQYKSLFFSKFRPMLIALSLTLSTLASTSSQAIDLQEFRLQDLVPILSEMKAAAGLSANQQALFLQVENKTKAMTRVRDERRSQIQQSLKKRLKEKAPELRDVMALMNQDDSISAQENQEMREAWMGFYDALSDSQRDIVAALLSEQLLRVADRPKDARPSPEGSKGGPGGQRGGRGGQGGMGNHNGGSQF